MSKPITTKQVSGTILAGIIAHAKANPGFVTQVAAAMSKRMRRRIHRQLVGTWLRADYDERSEPLHGAAAVMIEEARKIMEGGK